MCVLAGLAFLFLGAAGWNLFQGDIENAKVGSIAGVVLGVFAAALGYEESKTQEFLAFLVENEEKLKSENSIEYRGIGLSLNTEITQYYICVSFLILTLKIPSRFYIRGNHNTVGIASLYSLATLILGWWGIPFGPIYTIQSLYKNLRGGDKRPISQLLTEIERTEETEANTQQEAQIKLTQASK